MQRETLPIAAVPAWSKLNDVSFLDIAVQDLGNERGSGLVTDRALSSEDIYDTPTLLIVPRDLILSAAAVEEHARVDVCFREMREVAGGKSSRGDVLLFLLMQMTIASSGHPQNVGVKSPWTEYCRFLPESIPVPTLWDEDERVLLVGTSLESALDAKLIALIREFETLREQTIGIQWCQKAWWENDSLKIQDWLLIDAWYRSRCLELPNTGECMVPCLDMANHSARPNSYYEQTSDDSVALLLRPGITLDAASELTISYGDLKSEAEMLFSYGFMEDGQRTSAVVLPLEPSTDDPLGKAKLAAFDGQPVVRVSVDGGESKWESPFAYLICLNEEDGLQFRVLQEVDGSRSQLRVFWQGDDVTEVTDTFESLTRDHELRDIFRLRTVALLQDRTREQLERLFGSEDSVETLTETVRVNPTILTTALRLRSSEGVTLQKLFSALETQKAKLLESTMVLRYLGLMGDEEGAEVSETNNNEDDFS